MKAPFLPAVLLLCAFPAPAPAQCPLDKLHASDAESRDRFGRSLAVDGGTAVVGTDPDAHPGKAYVFELGADGWTETAALTADDGDVGDHFGYAVGVSGDTVVVGASWDDDFGPHAGAVYVFERAGTDWVQTQKLAPAGIAAADRFGEALAIQGAELFVGAFGDDPIGAVYVFARTPSGWVERQRIVPSHSVGGTAFGSSLAVLGDRLAVGAPSEGTTVSYAGAVYLFERGADGWVEEAFVHTDDAGLWHGLGIDVALGPDLLVAGAWRADGQLYGSETGAVYLFEGGANGWAQSGKLFAYAGSYRDYFGRSVDLLGDVLVVGGQGSDWGCPSGPCAESGRAYVFERGPAGWTQTSTFSAADTEGADLFGYNVALGQGEILVAARGDDDSAENAGALYTFRPPANAGRFCAALPSSTGSPAYIYASGCEGIAANDLLLRARPVPAQHGLFLYGAVGGQQPFGDGFLCVSGTIYRLPLLGAHSGALNLYLDVTAPPSAGGQITAGSTWKFQAWFRDPAAGGAGFNLSDGLSIQFLP